jgi:DNA-binding NarL/FixJ family response regulator
VAVRVVLAEDDFLVREGVRRSLERDPTVDFVAAYEDADSLLAGLDGDSPDVVITDIRMPPHWEDEGVALAAELHRSRPSVGVIVLSQVATSDYARAIFEDGAAQRAYVLKERVADRAGLVRVIHAVADGGSYVDPEVVMSLVTARSSSASRLDELSAREREVLALLAEGLSNGAIAKRLYLTKRSVEGHINSIFVKLKLPNEREVSRRVAATLLFLAETGAQGVAPP